MDDALFYRVAIVDDCEEDALALEALLAKFSKTSDLNLQVKRFPNASEFLKATKKVDIVFLDIDMPEMNGLELAKKIRQASSKILIIFCTQLEQFAINGYEVNALGYLLKPIDPYWFEFVMNKAASSLRAGRRSIIVVKSASEQKLVNISDIVYIEVQVHNIYYYCLQEGKLVTIKSRGTMREVSDKLAHNHFARCSMCYLVNLRKVIAVKKNEVVLPGATLPISRTFKQEFNEEFMQYLSHFEV